MAAIGQKLRVTVRHFGARRIERSHRPWGAACRCNLVQNTARPWTERDDSFLAPGASVSDHDVCDIPCGPSGDLDRLQLVWRVKTNRAAVGRPEWIKRVLRTGQRLCLEGIQRSDPEHQYPVRSGRERDFAAVRGNGKRLEGGCFRRQNGKPHRAGGVRSSAQKEKPKHSRCQAEQRPASKEHGEVFRCCYRPRPLAERLEHGRLPLRPSNMN